MYKTFPIFVLRISGFDLQDAQIFLVGLQFLAQSVLHTLHRLRTLTRFGFLQNQLEDYYLKNIVLTFSMMLWISPVLRPTADVITKIEDAIDSEKFSDKTGLEFNYKQLVQNEFDFKIQD